MLRLATGGISWMINNIYGEVSIDIERSRDENFETAGSKKDPEVLMKKRLTNLAETISVPL